MYDTRFKGSFKAIPIYVYKPRSIRRRTLGLISCNTTTSRPLQPIPLNWVLLELLQGSDSSQTIAPHWSSSYPMYLSPEQDKEQRSIVWTRLWSHRANLASRLSEQKNHYLALRQELNPSSTQVKSSHEPLFRDRAAQLLGQSKEGMSQMDSLRDCLSYCSSIYTFYKYVLVWHNQRINNSWVWT